MQVEKPSITVHVLGLKRRKRERVGGRREAGRQVGTKGRRKKKEALADEDMGNGRGPMIEWTVCTYMIICMWYSHVVTC